MAMGKGSLSTILQRAALAAILLFVVLLPNRGWGQTLSQYTFSASSGTFSALTSSNVPIIGDRDEGYVNNIPIGFTFKYCGVDYTSVSASTNGWLTFGQTISNAEYDNNLANGGQRPLLAPLWDDLDMSSGAIRYITAGTAPNRIFTIEWRRAEWNYNANSPVVSFQVKLYESSGIIDFIYKRESANISGGSASIGITDGTAGDGHYLSLNGTGTNPTASSTNETSTLDTKPANGQVYRFAPPLIYYSQGDNPTIASNWNTLRLGGGSSPINFSQNNQVFVVQPSHSMIANAAWAIAGANTKIQVEYGASLTANASITLPTSGIFQLDANATYNHNVANNGIWAGTEVIDAASTVAYGASGVQNVAALSYGNLTIGGGGTKTMQGNVTVKGTLNLTNGNISLGSGSSNLTLASGATISGSFDSNHMVVCDGTGSLVKQGSSAADFAMVYPVGTGAVYTPYEIASLTATGTGSVAVRAVASKAPGAPAANDTDLKKYWAVATSGLSGITANVKMTYNNSEVGAGGDPTSYIPWYYNGVAWSIPTIASGPGANPATVNGTNSLSGQWTVREQPKYTTYYSYQSGEWSTATTWTTDPSGTLSVAPAVPTPNDRVVILNGRTVAATANVYNVLSVQINEGGTLDLGNYTTQSFTVVRGQGVVRLSSSSFPTGDWTNFVSAGGGTVEYYNGASFNFSTGQTTYNNLIVNLSGSTLISTLVNDMVVNGNLTIKRGELQVNNNSTTNRSLTIMGNVYVSANGSIGLGSGNANHRIVVKGNFTNDGEVIFSEFNSEDYNGAYLSYYPYATADVVFNNATADQSLQCNGTSNFYRIEIDKGIDQTYVLNIDASNSANFRLFGRNDMQHYKPNETPPNLPNPNALGLLAGTVRLGNNIVIPCLGIDNGNYGVYNVDEDAQLWLDGATVVWNATGQNYDPVVYGRLRLTGNSYLDLRNCSNGLVLRTTGLLSVEGGQLDITSLRVSSQDGLGTHRGAYYQSGGIVNVTGGSTNFAASFMLPYSAMAFKMSGGTINILSPAVTGGSGNNFSLIIGASPNNVSVTGGTINITTSTGEQANINSSAPFWDLNILGSGTTYLRDYAGYTNLPYVPAITAPSLIVLHNLSINGSSSLNTNSKDVFIGSDFLLNTGAYYLPGDNTTIFNSLSGQRIVNLGTIGLGGNGLYNLTVTNKSNLDIFSNDLIVRSNLILDSGCFLNDVGHSIRVNGNIINSGMHTSQASGAILLNGATKQTVGGDGNGIFGNLNLNNGAGATLAASQSVEGNLRLAAGVLDIGSFSLKLGSTSNVYDALTGTAVAGFGGTRMVRLAGLQSDAGITKAYGSTANFLFPIGTANGYTPANIRIGTAPTAWGTVTVRPVAQMQPFTTSTNALTYYWKVTSAGFEGLQPNSITHSYQYVNADATNGTEASYIPAAYRPYSWVPINDNSKVVDNANTIYFNGISYVDGDYTAGEPSAFAAINVFYSRQDGDWNNPATWSTEKVGGVALPLTPVAIGVNIPGPNNPVVIGDAAHNHKVTVPGGFNSIKTGGLQISSGSTLDLTTTTEHNFGAIPDSKVLGTGTLRISSNGSTAEFPGGDFGNFLSSGGGTVEYYNESTLGSSFTLPTSYKSANITVKIATYNNLVTAPAVGKTITLPNTDLMVFGNYLVGGTGFSHLNANSASKTLTIETKLEVLSNGTLRYPNEGAQSVIANGDIVVNSGGVFDVATSGAATNLLSVKGNLTNNGTFDMNTGGSAVCNVTFTGDINKEINGTGAITDFNRITVNKGSSRNTLLEVKSAALSLNTSLPTALTLTNGTFRLTSPLTLALTNSGSFTIPISGCLSANGGTINIGGASASNTTDLKLDGRLELLAGAVNIGPQGGDINNDIEYSSGGTPEIIVGGTGKLFVNGQIRRVVTINTGSLSYSQSGNSEVTIAGRNANNSRAMLEVLNAGSKFDMSDDSKLSITGTFSNSSYPDLYLAPESSTVLGGTVILGSGIASANSTFNMVTSVPLWNLTIDGTTSSKKGALSIYPLVLKGDLTIDGNSSFMANGLDVTIGGDLINKNGNAATGITAGGYQAGSPTQNTIFNGISQSILGNGANLTNFANLVAAPSSTLSLTPNSNIRVNGNLTLNSGVLNDGGNTITLIGNVYSQAKHVSPSSNGGISFEGGQPQVVSGNGAAIFGNIGINNSLGLVIRDNLQVDGKITFTTGSIYLDDYQLTLGKDATIAGANDSNRMIILNGVISDAGVKKIFNSGASMFTYPIGVAGKYTPVTYNFTANANNGAYVIVKPVNYTHPEAAAPTTDQLKYYWNVTSSGFSGSYVVDHTYGYLVRDVAGTEANYRIGRFVGGVWDPSGGIVGGVDATNHLLKLVGKTFVDGEYTAGESVNFISLPILYSIASDDWFKSGTWSTTAGGSSCSCIPNGNPVVISSGHTVTLGSDGANAYSVDIQGTLDVGLKVYHNIGHVVGNGKLVLTSTSGGIFVFPGGNFDVFASTAGSTIEFKGDNEATLPLKPGNNYKPYQNVIFSGLGKKLITAEDLKVLGDLTISSGATLSNELFNRTVTALGNWTDENTSGSGGFIPGRGLVVFNGTSNQKLSISNGTTTERFYNLKIDNAQGVTIAGSGKVAVDNLLYLTKGNVTTSNTNLLTITNTNSNAVVGGGTFSFVNGPLRKSMNAGGYFAFPVGDAAGGVRFGRAVVSEISALGEYTAQYFNHNPNNEGYDPAVKTAPVDVVSNTEYWKVNGPAGVSGNVTLRWDSSSGIIPVAAASRQKLRVVEWNSSWINRGNLVTDGGVAGGAIKTAPVPISLNGDHIFTIGVESLPTATITGGTASICDDGSSTNIPITLTGTGPWNIKYRINGANETSINNIATSPYSLVVSNALPVLASGGPGSYVFTISYVQDKTGSTGIGDFTTSATITLKPSPKPVITGLTTTPANSSVIYRTSSSGSIYEWTITGGMPSTSNLNPVSVTWGTGAAGTLVLKETIDGCSITTPTYNVTLTDIPDPVISGNGEVCMNSIHTYSTPNVSSHTYEWTVIGGTPATGTSNSIAVTWTTVGKDRKVILKETGSISVEKTLTVAVNPLPSALNTVSDPLICTGSQASIVVAGADGGIDYQLRLNSDNSNVGSSVSSMAGGDVTLIASPVVSSVYNVWATNEFGCNVQLADLSNVTVKANPIFTLAVDNTNSCAGDKVVLAVTSSDAATYTWPSADSEILSVVDTSPADAKKKQVNWKPNSGLTFSGFPPQITKTLSITGTLSGCSTTKTVDVVINRKPETGLPYHIGNNIAK